ncbi:MAG TPA: hypothetical protein VM619_05885 [Luteimonas sp.]|nr:hypothetical protein [Luteimonas sp.]
MAKSIIADSGFWIGLFNARDAHHSCACSIEEFLAVHSVVIPWPSLYETLNTRLMRRQSDKDRFNAYLRRDSTVLLEDAKYKNFSLKYVLDQRGTTYSLVDHVIRSMLEDSNIRVDALITFNPGDFIDVCQARGIEILDC